MTFLAPAALIGLSLLALPILVHLFKPRKMKPVPFSSLRWLRMAQQRQSRRIQWHQWLLFLLRAGFIVLLVLALMKPLFAPKAGAPTDRLIVLDAGRRMSVVGKDEQTPWDRAKDLARRLAEQSPASDRTALVAVGGPVQVLGDFSADPAPQLLKLQGLKPWPGETSLTEALPLVSALRGGESRPLEIIFLTANPRTAWQQDQVQAFAAAQKKPIQVQVIDVSDPIPENAWITNARVLQNERDRWVRIELGSVGGEAMEREVVVEGLASSDDNRQKVTLTPGRVRRVDVRLPAAGTGNKTLEIKLEPADKLPDDDQFFLALDAVGAVRVLVIETDESGQFVKTGLDALGGLEPGTLQTTMRSPATLTAEDVGRADAIVLAGLPALPDDMIGLLEKRVRQGAGMLVFLGPGFDRKQYDGRWHKSLQPSDSLVSLALAGEPFNRGLTRLGNVAWSHPVLAPLRDPLLSDFGLSQFERYLSFKNEPPKEDRVLARFEDDTPALIEHPLGQGRVLIWNSSATEAWADLVRRRCFVPFLDQSVNYLAGARRPRLAGETLVLSGIDDASPRVVGPKGEVHRPRALAGAKGSWVLDPVIEPGIYRVGAGERPMAINVSRAGSSLANLDEATLKQWWAPAELSVKGIDVAQAELDQTGGAWRLWPWLVLLAGVLLIVETLYAAALCPKKNKAVRENVVPDRGILRPLDAAR